MTDVGPALTLGQMLDRAAARFPDRTAVVFKRERISYADLKRRADDFARGLLALGLRAGDPKVLDVSIVGVPDAIMGEAVIAFVIPKDGAALEPEEIVAFARGKIASFKVPRYVEIVDRFPLTGSGKVQKFKQKAWAVEKYALRGP